MSSSSMSFGYSQRVWLQTSILLFACTPVLIVAAQFDSRMLNDLPIWIKPLKFHVSVPLHLLTLAILLCFLSEKTRSSLWLGIVAWISAAATLVEMLLIDFQAARGVHSHFNYSSQFDGAVYAMMGVCALLLSAPALILGVRFMIEPVSSRLSPGLKWGTVIGLTAGFVLTLGIAGYMSTLPTGHWVDAPRTDLNGLPITGWSQQGGDLRVPHFFATHLMQILPLAGYLLDKYCRDNVRVVIPGIVVISIVAVGITIGTFLQAMSGQAFIS